MIKLNKYRQLGIAAIIVIVVFLIFNFAAIWSLMLNPGSKSGAWAIAFLVLMFVPALGLFLISYQTTNARKVEEEINVAYESGKAEMIREFEKKTLEGSEQKKEEEDVDQIVATIMSGIKGARTETSVTNKILASLARQMEFVQGILYLRDKEGDLFKPMGDFALTGRTPASFKKGENLNGQVAENQTMMIVYDIPENYFNIVSGLGVAKPKYLLVVPVVADKNCIGVLELAAFKKPDSLTGKILQKVSGELGKSLTKFIVA